MKKSSSLIKKKSLLRQRSTEQKAYKVKEKLVKNKPERGHRWICTMSATLIKY